jgi:predicted GNAT family acetyltransferase
MMMVIALLTRSLMMLIRRLSFTAFYIQKNKEYMNHYAFAVKPELQGKGFGAKLWEITIKLAKEANCKRLKTRADERKSGFRFFYKKLGWLPIAKDKHEFIFDISLENINTYTDFRVECTKEINPGQEIVQRYSKFDWCRYNCNNYMEENSLK